MANNSKGGDDRAPYDSIGYVGLLDQATREVARQAIEVVSAQGIQEPHCLYIEFITAAAGVKISPQLKKLHPQKLVIVLQHTFEDLEVSDRDFSVTLYFDGQRERITVPISALTGFHDIGLNFALQFVAPPLDNNADNNVDANALKNVENLATLESSSKSKRKKPPASKSSKASKAGNKKQKQKEEQPTKSNVLDLKAYRKKRAPNAGKSDSNEPA